MIVFSAHREAPVDRDGLADDEAGPIAAQPEHRVRDLLGAAVATDRHQLQHFLERFLLTLRDHLLGHRRPDHARADGVDPDAPGRVLQRRALGQAEHAMLRRVVRAPPGAAHEPPERRAVHDRAAALLPHLAQLELHAAPDAAEVNGHHPVVVVARGVGRFRQDVLDARVVVRRVQTAEGGHRLIDHRLHLRVIGPVTANGEHLVTPCGQPVRGRTHRLLVPVREHHRGTGLGKRLRGCKAQAGGCAGNERDFVFECDVHDDLLMVTSVPATTLPSNAVAHCAALYCSSLTFSSQSTTLPSSSSWMAMCVMAVVGAAPCQCFSPGGNQTTSPGRISSIGPPQRCARPQPAVTIRVWPSGWVCHAVRAPGSNVTLAPPARAGAGALYKGSTRTVPVNHSAGPWLEGCVPTRLMSMLNSRLVVEGAHSRAVSLTMHTPRRIRSTSPATA